MDRAKQILAFEQGICPTRIPPVWIVRVLLDTHAENIGRVRLGEAQSRNRLVDAKAKTGVARGEIGVADLGNPTVGLATRKSWGGCLGRAAATGVIIAPVTGRAATVELSIDIGSDPISGSFSVDAGAAKQFRGWIELVAAIESARDAASGGFDQALGALPGVKRGAV